MRKPHCSLLLVLSASALCLLAGPLAPAQATTVSSAGEPFIAESVAAVTFTTVPPTGGTPGTISCAHERVTDKIPTSATNPNAGGSVMDDIGNTSPSALVRECVLVGQPGVVSGGLGGIPTMAWSANGVTNFVTWGLSKLFVLFTYTFVEEHHSYNCRILVGVAPVQAMFGTWTNATSRAAFERQSLIAEVTGTCPFTTPVDQLHFSGVFHYVTNLGAGITVGP